MNKLTRRAMVGGTLAATVPFSATAQEPDADLEANKALIAGWIEATNTRDLSAVDRFIHDDYSTPATGALPGKEAYRQRLASNWSEPGIMSDEYSVVDFMVAEGNRVGVVTTVHIPWNNTELLVPQFAFYLIQEGLIIEAQGAIDEQEFQKQLAG